MRRQQGLALFVAAAGMAATLPGCATQEDLWKDQQGLTKVVVSFPPLASFVKGVAGDRAAVRCLCTAQGPHHYEYSVTDAAQLRGADFFFANGLSLDDQFTDKMHRNSGNARLRYVVLGERLPEALRIKGDDEHAHEGHDHAKGGGHDHDHGSFDPHVWLGIEQAVRMVEEIRDEFKKADAAHTADYDRNASSYIDELKKLQADGQKLFAKKKDKRLISFHESLNYFARSYGLTIADVIEEGPGDEPTSPRLARLVDRCVKDKIAVIAVEPQYPKSTSASVLQKSLAAKGVSVKLVEIDPLETSAEREIAADWYAKKMRENLEALARGLPDE